MCLSRRPEEEEEERRRRRPRTCPVDGWANCLSVRKAPPHAADNRPGRSPPGMRLANDAVARRDFCHEDHEGHQASLRTMFDVGVQSTPTRGMVMTHTQTIHGDGCGLCPRLHHLAGPPAAAVKRPYGPDILRCESAFVPLVCFVAD